VTTPTGGTEHFVLKARNGKTKTKKTRIDFYVFCFGVTGDEEKKKKSLILCIVWASPVFNQQL
jgi:hypothetical protein